jgi:hypothetical protein
VPPVRWFLASALSIAGWRTASQSNAGVELVLVNDAEAELLVNRVRFLTLPPSR